MLANEVHRKRAQEAADLRLAMGRDRSERIPDDNDLLQWHAIEQERQRRRAAAETPHEGRRRERIRYEERAVTE